MKIFISVFGRFHAYDLARELNKKKKLYKIATTYPYFFLKKYGLRRNQVISFSFIEILARLGKFLPNSINQYYNFYLCTLFDFLTSLFIRKEVDFLVCWSGSSKITINKSKKLGIKTFLERGSAHIKYQEKILLKEEKKFNANINKPHHLFIKKEIEEYRLTDYINVPTRFAYNTFNNFKLKKKIFINNYGVNTSNFRCLPKKKLPYKKFILLYSGGLSFQKGSHYLLKAIYNLRRLNNFEFWHLGSVQNEMIPFQKKYSAFNIKFLGHQKEDDLFKFYNYCSVFCIPSIHDGFPLVIPQALSCGLPVICTKEAGGEDFIINNFNGIIIKSRSSKDIEKAIKKIYFDKNLLRKMKKNSIETVKHRLTWSKYTDRFILNLGKNFNNINF